MTDDKMLKNAKNAYAALCAMLDGKNMHYKKYDDDLIVTFGLSGEDIPMEMIVSIDVEKSLVRLISPIPATFAGDKRIIGAIAACKATYDIADGSFDFEFKKGKITFRMTSSFLESVISPDVFEYMVGTAGYTIDEYNDKFFMLSKGQMTIEEFFKKA